ncbi:MAG: hypothetical protein OJF51_002250 [Nitrospira sp.]|nr:MAG: hypothetical protein OJF51_002250 [Nitrospira sp.]
MEVLSCAETFFATNFENLLKSTINGAGKVNMSLNTESRAMAP